jgi:hypothetical protein
MKTTLRNLLAAIFIAFSFQTYAQGLVYDQQSTIPPSPLGDYFDIQEDSPLTQSFIPTLSAIGFVQFEFWDFSGTPNNGNNGATVYVNLWTGSPDPRFGATLLGSTAPVYMPNGFGSIFAGVTNFYFSTSIILTPGQTYYLQPVVVSGDDPWDIWAPGDTYPNGQLFEKGAGFSTDDLWFREGVVSSVPEPSALVLIGLDIFLIFAFKRRLKLFVALLLFAIPVLSIHAAPDSVVQATADETGLAPVSSASLPDGGTFWVMTIDPDGDLKESPDPFLPPDLSTLPIYLVTGDIFIVDDTGGQLAPASVGRMSTTQAASAVQAQAEDVANLIEQIQASTNSGDQSFQPNYTPLSFDTNGLWLEASNEIASFGLRLHNTIVGDNYQLLSTSNLESGWNLGEILTAPDVYTDFSPVPITNTMTFFKAHHANPVMEIEEIQDSKELNPTNPSDPGQTGIIYIQNKGWQTNDVTVYYSIGGTAQNGIDYSNITGVAVVSNGPAYAEIDIDPIADGFKPDQTIILTLLQNTNYLIDPANYSATNNLVANPQVYPIASGDKEQICPNITNNIYLQSSDPQATYTILTWPTHGNLFTNDIPNVTYTPTNCYEGGDSFTFTASDGQYTSTPANVTLIIADPVSANPVSAQTCRGARVPFALDGSDNCSETLSYALLSNPFYGTVTNVSGKNYVYIPTGTNFTGTDSFDYVAYNECGDAATNTVTITVGDAQLFPLSKSVLTGTNRQVAITLSVVDGDSCTADTNYYTYTISGGLTNGYLTGTPPHLTYTPTNGEGVDSFQFTVSDGTWTSPTSANVTLYVVAGPLLTIGCDPFGPAVQLVWNLDTNVLQMAQQDGLYASDFIVYRSTNSGGNYTPIYTGDQMTFRDGTVILGQTNDYVVTFEFQDNNNGTTYESPDSNVIEASGQNPDDLISPDAVWDVWDTTDTNNSPVHLGSLPAPFSSVYPDQYKNLYPFPSTNWPTYTTWSNHITLNIPTNADLSQVKYSIAIDNDYQLYLNDSASPIDMTNHTGYAVWSLLQAFNNVAPNILHPGTNDIGVVIRDEGDVDYFSMIVTTNTCGW